MGYMEEMELIMRNLEEYDKREKRRNENLMGYSWSNCYKFCNFSSILIMDVRNVKKRFL